MSLNDSDSILSIVSGSSYPYGIVFPLNKPDETTVDPYGNANSMSANVGVVF